MNLKTEEFLIIALAIIIFVGISVVINPSITGYTLYGFSDFIHNDNIITENGIQLKQHSHTETWTTEETSYYLLTFAEKNGNDKLNKLIELDDSNMQLEKTKILKIRFDNNLENNDLMNLYLKMNNAITLNICDFSADSCENETIYASVNYSGQEGNYQVNLNLEESTNQFTIDSVEDTIKINYINSSHTEIIEHSNTTYYYNSAEVETGIIQPENLLKWDLFTADYTLNNQNLTFYYTTNTDYTEFTPPYNFSEINSSSLKFKLALFSDNTSTPIIYNLSINYIEYIEPCIENWTCNNWSDCINNSQTRTCTDQNNCETEENKPIEIQDCTIEEPAPPSPPSSSRPSVTRYKSTSPTTEISAPVMETHKVTQQVELPKETSTETIMPTGESVKKTLPLKLYTNIGLFILLTSLVYTYYHKRIKKRN